MPKMSKNDKNTCDYGFLTKTTKDLTKLVEEVAEPEIEAKCHQIHNLSKVMGGHITAVSTHSVSEMRQINMAGNI